VTDLALHLKPRADAASCLRILKNMGYELALMSAGSIDMINEESRQLDHLFDYQLSAEEACCYAPERRIFETAADRFDLYLKHSCYVTAHYWEGIVPANRAGLAKVWVHQDQKRGRKKEEPYGEVRSLKDLPLYFS
jgi:FMN phosphatase YigB (HAD superfamily)